MTPLTSNVGDVEELQALGRASVQIVHDLKNQLNGLKLYATFLRKRLEKSDRPTDELETVGKIVAGLERAAADMQTLVRYGRPLDLRPQPHVNLLDILRTVFDAGQIPSQHSADKLIGKFDESLLREAFHLIADSSFKPDKISFRLEEMKDGSSAAAIEWNVVGPKNLDPFVSFAGSEGLRLALAAKIIRLHGGLALLREDSVLHIQLPLTTRN